MTDKYNDKFGTSYKDFNELAEDFDYTVKSRCKEVNDMINSIRVCDPAVGSGHFLCLCTQRAYCHQTRSKHLTKSRWQEVCLQCDY